MSGVFLSRLGLLDHRPRIAFAATLAIGLACTLLAVVLQATSNRHTAQLRFDSVAKDAVERIGERLRTYEYGLQGARGMALANGPGMIGSESFARYVGSLQLGSSYPGLRELGLVWRVAPGEEASFIAQRRADGSPDFQIIEVEPHQGDHYVTTLMAPKSPDATPGIDVASEPRRRGVAETAMKTGLTSISSPVARYGVAGPPQYFFLLMLPIYREGAPVLSGADREAATIGWIGTALLMDKALLPLGLNDNRYTLALRDSADTAPFFTTAGANDAPAAGGLAQRIELPVYGRTWQSDLRATPRFLQELNLPNPAIPGAFGVLLSAALATLMHFLALGRRREQQMRGEQARRAAIVDGSNDAIICQALDGTVTDWNRGAEQLLGHPGDAVIGRRLAELLLLPEGRESEDAEIRALLLRGEPITARDTVRRHRDGTPLDVSLSASPILAEDGLCMGVATILRDISAARRAASELKRLNASLEARVAERTALLESARHDLQAILDALPTAIAYWDRTLHNRFRNRAHQRWFGDGSSPRAGQHISEVLGAEYKKRLPEIEAALRGEARVLHREAHGGVGNHMPLHTVTHYLPDTRDGGVQGFYVMSHDVTAATLVERRLRASEQFLDRAGKIAGVGGWELDLRTMALAWSAHTFRLHEVEPGHQPDVTRAIEFYPPEARPVITRAVEEGIAFGTPWDLELPLITAMGRRIWVRAQGTADMKDGKAVRLIGAFQDVTERKEATVRLEQAHERFAIAADSAHIGVWEYDHVSGSLVWDERMYRLYGQPPSGEVEPYSLWADSLHPDDRAGAEVALDAALRGIRAYNLDFRIVWPGGEVRHMRANAHVIRDAQGAPLRMTGVNIDITEQKRAELDLVETSSLLHTVLDSASEVSIIASDAKLKYKVFNTGAERLLGYSADEIVGRSKPVQIHDPDEIAARAEEMSVQLGRPVDRRAVFTEPSTLGQPREWTYVRKDGSRVRVSLIVTAMHGADGKLLGYLGIAHDVTRQKLQEKSLREAMHKARDASLAKSQFLANMSHEIRTPMNALIGLTYLLGQSVLDGHQADIVSKLQIAGKSLLGIINDVLDLSKIEAGELTLERAPFALRGVLADLTALMSIQANGKGIGFTVDAPAGLPAILDGDATRLGQVLTNLVANAVKFTERGGVKLSVSRLGDAHPVAGAADAAARTARLRFTVRDSGIGIPREVLPHLFAPFVQADASTTRRFGGTGLGLSIVKRLVTLMGGTVWVESLAGIGSTFWVDLELPVLDDASSTTPQTPTVPGLRCLHGVRILLTDDSDINLEVASRILMRHGANITVAHDGQQAVDLLRQRPDGFDVVLMDLQMPVLDGLEATLRIRNELGLRQLPVIALTAGAFHGEHASTAGMNDFIRKPFDPHGLVRSVLRHARPLEPQPAALATVTGWGDTVEPATTLTTASSKEPANDWPEITGIDRDDVRSRLGGDVTLFASMLRRLLREFGEIGAQVSDSAALDEAALAALAARMHKLQGSASTLGATAISRLAERTEAACRAHQGERACRSGSELATQLEVLGASAAAVLDRLAQAKTKTMVTAASDAAAPGEFEASRLDMLLDLLETRSLAALDRFDELAPRLEAQFGDSALRRLEHEIHELEFESAAARIRQMMAAPSEAQARPDAAHTEHHDSSAVTR